LGNIKDQLITDQYAIYNGDSLELMQDMSDNSIHFSIYSLPFVGLYHYSSSERDLSNSRSYEEFFEHYEFFVKEKQRITLPGRLSAVHCMDIPKAGANICGYKDFPGDIIRLHEKHGFEYLPRICIWKEPLGVRRRTMARALAHKTIVEDSTQTNVASADYLIPFRKKGTNPIPVEHPTGLHSYAGSREIPAELHKYKGWTGKQTENRFSHWIWRQYASCFWDDIRLDNVVPFKESKAEEDEKHVHPLQLDVIERAIVLATNPEEIVFTPFMGVGSEVYQAVKMGRKGIGCELKPSYYNQAVKNIETAQWPEEEQLTMFK
jgi:DNA modification methylase